MASERRTPLLLKREQSASRLVEDGMDEMEDDKKWPSARDGLPRLLTKAQVPTWYKQAFIHSGYRPVTGSVRSCFASLGHVHNETVNVFSHLVPATLALVGVFYMPSYLGSRFPQASWVDQLVLALYLSTTVLCFTASALYHTLLCHSQCYFDLWVRIDYVAIILQILGSFVSGIYIGFYCEPVLQWLYWSMVGGPLTW